MVIDIRLCGSTGEKPHLIIEKFSDLEILAAVVENRLSEVRIPEQFCIVVDYYLPLQHHLGFGSYDITPFLLWIYHLIIRSSLRY